MKTYLKTNCSFTPNCLLSDLRLVTAPLLTCLAALFISVTISAAASGPSANPDAPSTFVTSTPKAPPQVRYMLIELGGRTVFDISQSGQIVGNKQFAPGLRHAAFWPSSRSAAIDLGTLPGLNSVAKSINPRREIVGIAFNDDFSVERPLFWASPNSAPVELPGLPAGLAGEVYHINPSGQIVGQFFNADFSVNPAVFWPNSNAAPIYLHVLSNELFASVATSINDSGNILGDACDQTALNVMPCFGRTARALRWRWLHREADSFTALSFSTVTASIMRETWLVTHIRPASPPCARYRGPAARARRWF